MKKSQNIQTFPQRRLEKAENLLEGSEMSEKDHVLRMLTRLENAFKYLIGMLLAIVIFLAFNYDSSAISIMATILVVVCVIGLVYVAYRLRKHLRRLNKMSTPFFYNYLRCFFDCGLYYICRDSN